MRKLNYIFVIVLIFITGITYSQNEANIWHFGHHCGIDFNSGEPVVMSGVVHYSNRSNATMSDSLGNFLFSFSGTTIWNSNGDIMQNGDGIIGYNSASQGALIVPLPGSKTKYYVFSVGLKSYPRKFHYSRIDMNLDNGLGGVEVGYKNIEINMGDFAFEKITAVVHSNNRDIWIITRIFPPEEISVDDAYLSYLLTPSGLNIVPVVSEVRHIDYVNGIDGSMKISPDKKYLVTAYHNPWQVTLNKQSFDICSFKANTGEIEYLYCIGRLVGNPLQYTPHAVEFSPDSKLMYLTYFNETDNLNRYELFQYDMQYVNDSAQFKQSEIYIGNGQACGLQLARDGRIYGTGQNGYGHSDSLGVINKPWERGTACDFQNNELGFGNQSISIFFQNIMLDYLYRFEWDGSCTGEAIQFQPNFINPETITWDFGDGTPTVTEINPEHVYSTAGEYEVYTTVTYDDPTSPFGSRIEETSRVVTIIQSPEPNLGSDTTTCTGEQVIINAGNIAGTYVWGNDSVTITFGQDIFEITVADSGNYWVRITNSAGCSATDTINVSWFAEPVIDEQNLVVTPTAPGSSNGSITGLSVAGTMPLSYEWIDGNGNIISTDIDIYNLAVGNYYLQVTDGNGCTTIFGPYTINAGDIVIDSVVFKNSHCGNNNGEIAIWASSASSNIFDYSIDNGSNWQSTNVFANLAHGQYFVWVKNQGNSQTVYDFNPVEITDIAGPQITNITTIDETNNNVDGQISITATAYNDSIWYSIDNGQAFQLNNGNFFNLSAGTYMCVITDNYGCDTTITIEIERDITQTIEAIAGNDYACIGNTSINPLTVSDFTDIKRFSTTLEYDTTMLVCEGYVNIIDELKEDISISTNINSNKIIINWEGVNPISLSENTTIVELVFKCIEEGYPGINWDIAPGESSFYNENGDEIPAEYTMGKVRVFTRPEIFLGSSQSYCEGDEVNIWAFVDEGSGGFSYHWEGPQSYSSDQEYIFIQNLQSDMQGTYTFEVMDTANCIETKQTEIIVMPSPEIMFTAYDSLYVEPGYILDAGNGNEYYLWNTGETTQEITIDTSGRYVVEVTSYNSCKSTGAITLLWGKDPFVLPNAFTPNGDGLNDTYGVVPHYDYAEMKSLSIFNRWGALIFETNDINTQWDGTYKGSMCMPGAYVVRVVYTEYYNQLPITKVQQGTVMLVR